jgi:hypothetical protein
MTNSATTRPRILRLLGGTAAVACATLYILTVVFILVMQRKQGGDRLFSRTVLLATTLVAIMLGLVVAMT